MGNPNYDSWLRQARREIPILVLGILIAFGLQAWWDNSRASAEEQQSLQALRSELVLNQEGLETNIRRHDRVADAVQAFHRAMLRADSEQISDSLLVAATVSPTFDPSTGAMESVQRGHSSDCMGLLQDCVLIKQKEEKSIQFGAGLYRALEQS